MEQRRIIDHSIKEINYLIIKQMEGHAKKYDFASDKKEFLKNVSIYEQKIILLNSKNPYEVLKYLEEIDLQNLRLVLDTLNYDEIKKILYLFSSEDKKQFYSNFSDLSLVSQFIMYDKNYYNYIKDLTFDRKVELLESLDKETVEVSSKIYENMSPVEKEKILQTVENPITSLALNNDVINSDSSTLNDKESIENSLDDNNIEKGELNELKVEKEELKKIEKKEDLKEELKKTEEKEEEIKNEPIPDLPKDLKEEKNIDTEIIDDQTNQNIIRQESLKSVQLFKESAILCEKRDIEKIRNELINEEQVEVTKTI